MDQAGNIIVQFLSQWQLGLSLLSLFIGIGTLIDAGKAYIAKTVTKKDDAWLASVEAKTWARWVMGFFSFFSALKVKK